MCAWSRDQNGKTGMNHVFRVRSKNFTPKLWFIRHDGVEDETLSRKLTVIWNFYQVSIQKRVKKCHRERSHMTSAAEGGGGFKMLTVADKGRGSKHC